MNSRAVPKTLVACTALFVVVLGTFLVSAGDTVVLASNNNNNNVPEVVAVTSNSKQSPRVRRRLKSFSTAELKGKFELAKTQLISKLEHDYGKENVDLIFRHDSKGNKTSYGRNSIFGSSESWDKMKRKVATKILEAQISEQPQPFIWATGGHSASAGHGNLMNETYTAVLEANSAAMFEAVGLEFTARNRAMGGTGTGKEIASCTKEVFGTDIDVLSWDYGMTTGGDVPSVELYFHRAALLPHRPYFMTINMDNKKLSQVIPKLEPLGPAMFSMSNSAFFRVPDSEGKSEADLEQMPPYVKCLRHGKKIENDQCRVYKYTDAIPYDKACDGRRKKASWHPGWKAHALYGNVMTLFWMEVIADALDEIAMHGSDPASLLKTLKSRQDQEYAPLLSKDPNNIYFLDDNLNSPNGSDIPREILYWCPNLCHTARLPAEIRYNGILTESKEKGYEKYDRGLYVKNVPGNASKEMPLTWSDSPNYDGKCPQYNLQFDQRDFFLAKGTGVSSITIPNPTEKSYYFGGEKATLPLMGYIAICPASCGWSCPPDQIGIKDIMNQASPVVSFQVNRQAVENVSQFGKDCVFLKPKSGSPWTANGDGQYEISAQSLNPSKQLHVSTYIIW